MPEFSSLAELENYLNDKIRNALETEVKKVAVQTMQSEVVTSVYDKYTPTQYERTGGLAQEQNIKSTLINDNTLEIENVREDEETGRLVAPVVESGTGYTWKESQIYKRQPFPRPFVENTAKDLEDGLARKALTDGLKRQGLDVT
jgi:hypothetical protein